MLKINLNNPMNSFISEKRLIFFAKKTGDAKPPKASDPKGPTVEEQGSDSYFKQLQEFAASQPKKFDEHGEAIKNSAQEIVDFQSDPRIDPNRKLETEGFREILEILKNPNLMARDEYKYFMKALAAGKLPGRMESLGLFLRALQAPKDSELHRYAKSTFKKLSSPTSGPITKAQLKKLNQLDEEHEAAKEEELKQEVLKTTSASTGVITVTAGIHEAAIEKITPEKTPLHIEFEALPEDLERMLLDLKPKYDQANKMMADLEAKENSTQELFQSKDTAKLKALQAEIEHDRAELVALHKQIDLEYHEYVQKLRVHTEKSIFKRQALDKAALQCGLDLNEARQLTVWALDLAQGKTEDGSLEIKGYLADKTGKTQKTFTKITVTALTFDPEDQQTSDESPGLDKMYNEVQNNTAGRLFVHYKDEAGVTNKLPAKNFFDLVNGIEAYQEIDSYDDLKASLAFPLWGGDLNDNDLFSRTALDLDEDGNKVEKTEKIQVAKVDHQKKTVTLVDPTKKISRHNFGQSIHNGLYFDRIQTEFSFGEFARFIKQNDYKKVIHVKEVPAAIQAQQEFEEKKYGEAVAAGLVSFGEFTPPTQIGETQQIFWVMPNGVRRKFNLKLTDDKPGTKAPYALEEILLEPEEKDMQAMFEAGYGSHFAASKPAHSLLPDKDTPKKWSIADLLEAHRRGRISDVKAPDEFKIHKRIMGDSSALEMSPQQQQMQQQMQQLQGLKGSQPMDAEMQAGLPTLTPEESGQKSEKEKGPQMPKAKFYSESLPYDKIHKVGGMETVEANYLKSLWTKTRFLSVSDIWEMGKAMWEYYDRRFQRRQKDRYSSIGTELPFFAPEMRRINQATETEAMNQFKEAFDQKGVFEIWDRLAKTHNRDELKACFVTLASKGMIRWDDINVWKNLNRFVSPDKAIPIPSNGDPNTIVEEPRKGEKAKTGMDFLKPAIDSLWGEGQYNDWYSQNKSTYQSNAQKYYEEGKELEGVEGGHGRRLATLLQQHKQDTYVNPQEYEGLILHSIFAGKAIMQEKIYYMIEGLAAESPSGRTILSFDRMAHINSEMLIRFPILEYLCAPVPRPPDGKKSHRFTLDDYKVWAKDFDDGDPTNCYPTPKVDKFMWEKVIPSDETQNRINKAIRNGENFDHDDMFAYLPPATEEVVTDSCKSTTGSKKFLTIEGYANAFPGFSQYLMSCSQTGKLNKLREGIKSYVRFEAIMTNRFRKHDDGFQRMGRNTLSTPTICSNSPPQAFINELNTAIEKIVQAYDDTTLNEIYKLSRTETPNFTVSPEEQRFQKKVDWAFEQFGDVFDKVVKSDNGAKMAAIMAGSKLEGMPWGLSGADLAARKAKFADAYALE